VKGNSLAEFRAFRERKNAIILNAGNLTINRFFALDSRAYEAGALGVKTKEMLEVFAVGLVVGGSIVIPHLRRAMARLEELRTA
jgi:glycerol-3-phosphate responsive antiterminator